MSAANKLERILFNQSRDREYFDRDELATMTGQSGHRFPDVIVKELADNALDAAETAGVVPKLILQVWRRQRDLIVSVKDNGNGILPEAVERILDFRTRTSDKAAYRSPTRGLQGNALKTIIGMPYALGSRQPLVIEARGKKHIIRPRIDPAGEARIQHSVRDVVDEAGTRFQLALPLNACSKLDLRRWMRGYSLFNPHAIVKFRDVCAKSKHAENDGSAQAPTAFFYNSTVRFPEEWKKFLPTDLIPVNWYDAPALGKLIFNHIAKSRQGGPDLTLREFICLFPGFTSTRRVSRVCGKLPAIKRLTDFEDRENLVPVLLAAMQEETASRPPRPEKLGLIGEDHFRTRFHEWFGVKQDTVGKPRFWYGKACLEVDGVPYVFEAAVAQTDRRGQFFHGVNFSPTFSDPFAGTDLHGKDCSGYGVAGYLSNAHAYQVHPYPPLPFNAAVAVHLVSPALQFLDKGKTHLEVPEKLAAAVGDALWDATKVLYREEERRKRDAAKQQRAEEARAKLVDKPNLALTKVMPLAMPESLAHATGNHEYEVSAHTLFYSARKVFQTHTSRPLESQYFEQQLLPPYLRTHPEAARLIYREPRGVLYEPHTGIELPLGTREVACYQFPLWRYQTILFVEKQGLYPVLRKAQLGERYDMAIVAGEGFATEACRILFANAEKGDYQIFVLHDADPWGYNIARTLREETERMPGYNVDVKDIGLTVADALDPHWRLDSEWATRDKSLPSGLKLTPLEEEFFVGEKEGKKTWKYRRFELNAFTAPQLIEYLEHQLHAKGCKGKVIPPAKELPALIRPIYENILGELVEDEIRQMLSLDTICQLIARQQRKKLPFKEAVAWINEAIAADPTIAWDKAVRQKIGLLLGEKSLELKEAISAALKQKMGAV